MDIVLVTTVIACLFLVIAAAEPLAARLRVPYSVILALLGVLIRGEQDRQAKVGLEGGRAGLGRKACR